MDDQLICKALKTIRALATELQACRWALWNAIDGWENRKEWGMGFGGPETNATDVGLSLVHEGRRVEAERDARGMNEPMKIEAELVAALSDTPQTTREKETT